MRKIILTAAVVAAAYLPAAQAAQPVEGCQAVAPVIEYCNYLSTSAGSVLGVGSWSVVVHWSGECADEVVHGENGWIRSSANGDNNIEGIAGGWQGSVNGADYCVEAFADAPGSAVFVGTIAGLTETPPPEQ